MAHAEMVKLLDFILNRCDLAEIDIVSAAVVRRKRDLELFAQSGMSDPNRWAAQTAETLGTNSSGFGLDSIRNLVHNMVGELLHKEAPELSEENIQTLLSSWLPGPKEQEKALPREAVLAMVEQFVGFSHGLMSEEEDAALREQFGAWPQTYWEAFPAVVRQVVTEYLEGNCDEQEYRAQLLAAVDVSCAIKSSHQDDTDKREEKVETDLQGYVDSPELKPRSKRKNKDDKNK